MSLATLPPEIFNCVVANIESKNHLCNLARCSRQLNLCTMPHLYRHIAMQAGIEQHKEKLQTLASTLIQKPDHAKLVESFTLLVILESPEKQIDCALSTAVRSWNLDLEEESKWLRNLNRTHSCHDSILALLLHALPKVKKLDLSLPAEFGTYFFEQMMGRAARRDRPFRCQSPFEALTVVLLSHEISDVQSPKFLASLLKLPALEVLSGGFGNNWEPDLAKDEGDRIYDEYQDDEEIDLKELNSSSSPITSLNITAHSLRKADFGHILRAPNALKKFFYTFSPGLGVDWPTMLEALAPYRDCLESLGFDYSLVYEMYHIPNRDNEFLGDMESFIDLNTLKVLKIPALFFETTYFGNDGFLDLTWLFPPKLETLHLTRFQARYKDTLEALEGLLTAKSPEQNPSLTRLILEETKPCTLGLFEFLGIVHPKLKDELWEDTQETAIERLSKVAAAQGITFEVTYC